MLNIERLEDRLVLNSYWFNPVGNSGDYGVASSWHTISDNGPLATNAPTSADSVHFDNTKQCNLAATAAAASAYFDASAPVVNMRGYTWTISGGSFDFHYGTINFASGGHLVLDAIFAGTWTGSASFLGNTSTSEVTLQGGTLLSITDDTAKTLATKLEITGSELRWTTTGGADVDLGTTGYINVLSSGKLSFQTNGADLFQPSILCTHGTNGLAIVINGGTLDVYGNNGGMLGSTMSVDIEVPILMYAGAIKSRLGNLSVHNYTTNSTISVDNEGGDIDLYTSGQTFYAYDGGFYQGSGNVLINPDGSSGGTTHTQGTWDIAGGTIYFSSLAVAKWDMSNSNLTLHSTVDVYMTAGKNQTGDEIINVATASIAGTLHLAVMGTWAQGNTTKLIDTNSGISGSFGTRYYGWIGATNLDAYFSLANASGDLVATHL